MYTWIKSSFSYCIYVSQGFENFLTRKSNQWRNVQWPDYEWLLVELEGFLDQIKVVELW